MSRKRVLQTTAAPAAAVAANGHAKQSSSRDTNHRYPMTSCSCQLVPRCLLPGYLDDNIYLDDYHRPELGSVIECVKTLFCLHTETMNIWTHLAGCCGCAMLATYFMLTSQSDVTVRVLVALYFAGAIFCLGASSVFHAFNCHSEAAYRIVIKLDYCGIIILTVTSFPPWLYFAFYCHWAIKCAYIGLVTSLGVASVAVVLQDRFRTPAYLHLRAALFIGLGLTGFVPGLHYLLFARVLQSWQHVAWLFTMAAFYLLGGALYAARVPERLLPVGKCNIWFQSHQLMHVCVVCGILSCYLGIETCISDMHGFGCVDM